MIKIEVIKNVLCSGNIRRYTKKILLRKEFETEEQLNKWIEDVKTPSSKWITIDLSTLKIIGG